MQTHTVSADDLDSTGAVRGDVLARCSSTRPAVRLTGGDLGTDVRDELIAIEHAARHLG